MTLRDLLLLTMMSTPTWAAVTLGLSNENFTLTGIGPNGSGLGQFTMGWGSCRYDGTNTTCTLSGPFTGLGSGGTYSLVVTYPGNGPFPLTAVSRAQGSDEIFAQAIGPYSFVLTLAETNGPTIPFYSFANFGLNYAPGPTCTGVPADSCRVGQVGLIPKATITGKLRPTFDPTPAIKPSGVVSAGNYGNFSDIAPRTWIEIYGVNLANTRGQTWAASDFKGTQAPTALAGTTVTIAGRPSYVDFVSPGQVNVQVPSDVPTGSQPIVVTTAGGSSSTYNINVNAVQPGLLAPPAFMINGKQHVVALLSNTLTYVLPVTGSPGTPLKVTTLA